MAASIVQDPVGTAWQGGTSVASLQSAAPAVATTAGNLLIAVAYRPTGQKSTPTAAMSDSAGNTYTLDASAGDTNGNWLGIYSTQGTSTLAVPTSTGWFKLTWSSNRNNFGFTVWEAHTGSTGSLDVAVMGTATTTSPASSGATATVLGGAELIFGATIWNSTGTGAVSGGWTALTQENPLANAVLICGYQNPANASNTYTYSSTMGATMGIGGTSGCCVYAGPAAAAALPAARILSQAVKRAAYF